jgi:uncharacterized membrane-anchored protein
MNTHNYQQFNTTDDIYDYVTDLFVKEKQSVCEVKNSLINKGINEEDTQRIIDEISNRIKSLKMKRTKRNILRGITFIIIGFILCIESYLQYENLIYIGLGLMVLGIFNIVRGIKQKSSLKQNHFLLNLD